MGDTTGRPAANHPAAARGRPGCTVGGGVTPRVDAAPRRGGWALRKHWARLLSAPCSPGQPTRAHQLMTARGTGPPRQRVAALEFCIRDGGLPVLFRADGLGGWRQSGGHSSRSPDDARKLRAVQLQDFSRARAGAGGGQSHWRGGPGVLQRLPP